MALFKYRLESFRAREDLLLALEVIKDSCAHKSQAYIGNKIPDLEYRSA